MSTGSPSAYLLWALLSVAFFSFMLLHLWSYDRFKCLRWNSGRQPGAFKRVMTYSYFATVPLLMLFSVSMSALKYQEGSLAMPNGTIMARPFELWQPKHLRWILPLFFILSIAWALELVTHLEELTFWLFLLHQGPKKREWFHSWEFRVWYLGSLVAILALPLTTLTRRHDLNTCEAWIFLGGASAGTFTTVCFLYVLGRFPGFIRGVKAEGAEPDVIIRLSTFYHLNCIRVVFRFFFTVPLMILALDGLTDKTLAVVDSSFWTDLLFMMGGIGCFVSSAITMLIFFPRSLTPEPDYKVRVASAGHHQSKVRSSTGSDLPQYEQHESPLPSPKSDRARTPMSAFRLSDAQLEGGYPFDTETQYETCPPPAVVLQRPLSGARSDDTVWEGALGAAPGKPLPVASSSRLGQGNGFSAPLFVDGTPIYVEEISSSSRPQHPHIHPYAMNFTSPIDLPQVEDG